MAWFRKKTDLISDRARVLTDEIAALEAQIQKLGAKVQPRQDHPRAVVASSSRGDCLEPEPLQPAAGDPVLAHEPIFEDLGQARIKFNSEPLSTPEHYNELGVRKYDLPALLARMRNHLRGPSTTNPKLVSYLAAGGIQGLRPLRYEKRVARNRFIALVVILFLFLLGLIAAFVHRG